MKAGTPITITWRDHTFHFGEWGVAKTKIDAFTYRGYFVEETDDYVVIAFGMKEVEGSFHECLVVLKEEIISGPTKAS